MKNNYFIFCINLLIFSIFMHSSINSEEINFLSLKNDKVNLRQGPSFEYPIKLIYKKKYLPIIILDKSESWRHIKDFKNNFGWIHISQLSNKKSALNIKNNSILYKKSTIYSEPLAKLEVGHLVLIRKCTTKWCKIISGEFNGWILKNYLWGKTK